MSIPMGAPQKSNWIQDANVMIGSIIDPQNAFGWCPKKVTEITISDINAGICTQCKSQGGGIWTKYTTLAVDGTYTVDIDLASATLTPPGFGPPCTNCNYTDTYSIDPSRTVLADVEYTDSNCTTPNGTTRTWDRIEVRSIQMPSDAKWIAGGCLGGMTVFVVDSGGTETDLLLTMGTTTNTPLPTLGPGYGATIYGTLLGVAGNCVSNRPNGEDAPGFNSDGGVTVTQVNRSILQRLLGNGLGDTAKNILSAVGIKQTPDCACPARQSWLNKFVPWPWTGD